MTTGARPDGLLVDLVPGRDEGPRLLPVHDQVSWTPGDAAVLPEPVLGAALPLLLGTDPVSIWFPERTQPRTAFTLSWWVTCDDRPSAQRLADQTWAPDRTPAPAPAAAAAAAPGPTLIAVTMVRQRSRRTRVTVQVGPDQFHETVDLDTPSPLDLPIEPETQAEDWHHLAVTWNGADGTLTLHLDGQPVASHPLTSPHLNHAPQPRLTIDGQAGERKILWLGPVRLFDRIRTAADLLAERHDDRAGYPTLNQRHPLAFRLADDLDDPAIYITDDDAAGRDLHLVVENRSRFPVTLPRRRTVAAHTVAAYPTDLEFRFRPGCLAGGAHHWVEPHAPAWAVDSRDDDGTVALLVGRTTPLTLNPGQTAAITLHHVRADGTLGAHPTHVELRYPHPHHPGLTSLRVAPAEVRGQRGRRHSPLRLAVLGHQVVRNDGSANTFDLSLINTSHVRPIEFTPPVRGNGTRLTLSIDSGPIDQGWALATHDQLLDTIVTVDRLGPWDVDVDPLGERPRWILTPTRAQTLAPGERLSITLTDLRTTAAPGTSRADLAIENVPGYWDRDLHVEIHKSTVTTDADGPALDIAGDATVAGRLQVAGDLADRYGPLVPGGVIVMWHGSADNVPDGWVLCDGTNGTPDLSDRFIRSRSRPAPDEAGRRGGQDQVTLTEDHLPAHLHQVPLSEGDVVGDSLGTADLGSGSPDVQVRTVVEFPFIGQVSSASDIAPQVRAMAQWVVQRSARLATRKIWEPLKRDSQPYAAPTERAGRGQSFDNRPAFYDLCFIMKRLHPGASGP